MHEIDAMDFEYFIRRVYKCGRHGVANADADIYRKFEYANRTHELDLLNIENKQMRISTKPIETLKNEANFEARKIWSIVQSTILHAVKEYKHILSNDEITELNSLLTIEKATRENIEKAINRGNKILSSYKIYPK